MFRRNFFGAGPWSPARGLPTVRLAGAPAPRPQRTRLGALQNGCVVPGSGERPVFQYNPTTQSCGVFWMDTSTAQYPDCVKAPDGYPGGGYNGWVPPSCGPQNTPTPPPSSDLPPGFACPTGGGKYTIVDYRTGALIAENVIQEDWSKYVSDMTVLPPGRTCDDDSRCKPICGTTEPPPTTTSLPPTVACPMGNGLFSLVNANDGSLVADSIPRDQFAQYTSGATDLPQGGECSSDSRCAPVCNVSTVQPPYYGEPPVVPSCCTPYQGSDGIWMVRCNTTRPDGTTSGYDGAVSTLPPEYASLCAPAAAAPAAAPAPAPAPAPVTPGASVQIVPRPFPAAPQPPNLTIRPGPVPNFAPPPVPQKSFAPASINPSCKFTPYKTRMFAATTQETRPDEFTDKEQWTR